MAIETYTDIEVAKIIKGVEREQKAKFKKKKSKKQHRILAKPKVKIQGFSAEKAILKDKGYHRLVSEGRVGTFDEELMEEAKWLS